MIVMGLAAYSWATATIGSSASVRVPADQRAECADRWHRVDVVAVVVASDRDSIPVGQTRRESWSARCDPTSPVGWLSGAWPSGLDEVRTSDTRVVRPDPCTSADGRSADGAALFAGVPTTAVSALSPGSTLEGWFVTDRLGDGCQGDEGATWAFTAAVSPGADGIDRGPGFIPAGELTALVDDPAALAPGLPASARILWPDCNERDLSCEARLEFASLDLNAFDGTPSDEVLAFPVWDCYASAADPDPFLYVRSPVPFAEGPSELTLDPGGRSISVSSAGGSCGPSQGPVLDRPLRFNVEAQPVDGAGAVGSDGPIPPSASSIDRSLGRGDGSLEGDVDLSQDERAVAIAQRDRGAAFLLAAWGPPALFAALGLLGLAVVARRGDRPRLETDPMGPGLDAIESELLEVQISGARSARRGVGKIGRAWIFGLMVAMVGFFAALIAHPGDDWFGVMDPQVIAVERLAVSVPLVGLGWAVGVTTIWRRRKRAFARREQALEQASATSWNLARGPIAEEVRSTVLAVARTLDELMTVNRPRRFDPRATLERASHLSGGDPSGRHSAANVSGSAGYLNVEVRSGIEASARRMTARLTTEQGTDAAASVLAGLERARRDTKTLASTAYLDEVQRPLYEVAQVTAPDRAGPITETSSAEGAAAAPSTALGAPPTVLSILRSPPLRRHLRRWTYFLVVGLLLVGLFAWARDAATRGQLIRSAAVLLQIGAITWAAASFLRMFRRAGGQRRVLVLVARRDRLWWYRCEPPVGAGRWIGLPGPHHVEPDEPVSVRANDHQFCAVGDGDAAVVGYLSHGPPLDAEWVHGAARVLDEGVPASERGTWSWWRSRQQPQASSPRLG